MLMAGELQKYLLKETEENINNDINVISHGGGISGFSSLIVRFIDDKHLIILLDNTMSTKLYEAGINIRHILYNKPYGLPSKSIEL